MSIKYEKCLNCNGKIFKSNIFGEVHCKRCYDIKLLNRYINSIQPRSNEFKALLKKIEVKVINQYHNSEIIAPYKKLYQVMCFNPEHEIKAWYENNLDDSYLSKPYNFKEHY